MNTVNYARKSGQYVGAIVTDGDIDLSSNYFADDGCVVVPSAPESTEWFWDFDKKEWYLPESAISEKEREWRDSELNSLIWIRDRHRDQVELSVETNLSQSKFKDLLLYMQELRDWPQSSGFPDSSQRPVAPDLI